MTYTPPMLTIATWASADVFIALCGVATAFLGVCGAWEVHKVRKRKKLSADVVEQAPLAEQMASDKVMDSATKIIDEWQDMVGAIKSQHKSDMTRLTQRIDAETRRGDRLEREVRSLRRESQEQSRTIFRLRTSLANIQQWWDGVVADWSRVRLLEHPPAFPSINIDPEES